MKGDNGLMNCADIDRNEMSQIYKQSSTVEYAVKLTYVLAVVGARVENITTTFSDPICDRPTPECNQLIMDELESLDYVFGASDPAELNSQRLQFYRNKDDSVLISSGIIIEGILLFNDDHMVPMVIEYETGSKPRVINNNLKYLKIRSQCAPYRPFCGTCKQVTEVDSNKYFLSIPKEYPLYIMALFDFHDGRNCQSFKNSDISLPMSFIHTIWTFRKRYPQLKLLQNLDFGALLVDSCSIGKTAAEVIIIGETQCFTFQQADRNITIVPGSVFGQLYSSYTSSRAHNFLLSFSLYHSKCYHVKK
ncbi:unnamed protein product [Anisakis simplex]|uniref:CELF35-1 (inferred by orthology to a C. elegans protein) n=1 Tax=Anisakis simplex TaxID=6269 RepID=A0A0M3J4T6_ANISI|nr:unnamed protein product [Anisakis simplex]